MSKPLFSDSSEVLKFIKDTDVKFLDIRFTDLPGIQQHFNIPASTVDEDFFSVGQLFDGSSIRGFQSIHESDLQLIPDISTAYVDPFRTERTLVIIFDIYNPRNGEIYAKDPRQVAKKANDHGDLPFLPLLLCDGERAPGVFFGLGDFALAPEYCREIP